MVRTHHRRAITPSRSGGGRNLLRGEEGGELAREERRLDRLDIERCTPVGIHEDRGTGRGLQIIREGD